ncbi:arylamine N-acetyltransferase [Bacillus sp. AFS076308]|uniref:arylamine N-acetyltransferase family protein n=1 Tax=unclassified Bacillus (in: firmicutes) TaxID=185979 RepID=UPI000BF612B8|nr:MULTISPECIES: arylamine N-acetyltransferase [unclassified Bacillus (in: firmicutes)]PFN77010.1 arylamine N-acetyltransferase [Bacillus sp. AFS076308]PGV49130.1 arylamine N-acetyltransferase [Bacillus sp. AFS037270]
MSEFSKLFHERIGLSQGQNITLDSLDRVLEKTAQSIPFENICIINRKTSEISKANLVDKILIRREGGICYELNSLFYFYLIENGFEAALVRGVVYNHVKQDYQDLGRTHVSILVNHEGRSYVVDTGFGGNLPLKPVPLTGETVSSNNGEFRIRKLDTNYGDYVLEMKLKHKDTEWKIGYAFDTRKPIYDVTEFNEIQSIIAEHPESPFNKVPLLARLTSNGNITLTNFTWTEWKEGKVSKETIEAERFKELAKQYFSLNQD